MGGPLAFGTSRATTLLRRIIAATSGLPRLLRGIIGPALNLKELNLICWGLFIAFLVLPVCYVLHGKLKAGELRRSPEVDFIYVYSMGRIFNEHPAAEAYDYELQK